MVGSSITSPNSITTSATFTTTYNNTTYGTETSHNGVIAIGYNTITPTLTFSIPVQTTTTAFTYVLSNQSLLTGEYLMNKLLK